MFIMPQTTMMLPATNTSTTSVTTAGEQVIASGWWTFRSQFQFHFYGQSALMLCGWGAKADMAYCVCETRAQLLQKKGVMPKFVFGIDVNSRMQKFSSCTYVNAWCNFVTDRQTDRRVCVCVFMPSLA